LFQKPNFKLPSSLQGPLQTINNSTINITISKIINLNIIRNLDALNAHIMFLGVYGWSLGCNVFLAPQKFPIFGAHCKNLIWLHIYDTHAKRTMACCHMALKWCLCGTYMVLKNALGTWTHVPHMECMFTCLCTFTTSYVGISFKVGSSWPIKRMYVPMLGNIFKTLNKTYVISKETSINVGFSIHLGKKLKLKKDLHHFKKNLC